MPNKNNEIKIGILSDTHGNHDAIKLAMSRLRQMDHFIHLGDYCRDAEYMKKLTRKPVDSVRGNCDYNSETTDEKMLEIGGLKILLTHGHKYKVKYDNTLLSYRAEETIADVVLFGHTHIPETFCEGRRVFFNPGSLAEPRYGMKPTYGILYIREDQAVPMTYTLD